MVTTAAPSPAMARAPPAISLRKSRRLTGVFSCGFSGALGSPGIFILPGFFLHAVRVAIKDLKTFHGDGMRRAAFSAEPAADADGLVFHHHRALGGQKVARRQVLESDRV